jgi:predicted lactoylglutathione lyase
MKSSARLSLVTLGVRDVVRSTDFYKALGFPVSDASVHGDVTFFKTDGGILALWGYKDLAEDANLSMQPGGDAGYRGSALAMNLDSPGDVDACLAAAIEAGAQLTKPATATFYGGYAGYFSDPDGHLWEVAHNPHWPIGEDGRPTLP